MKPLLVGECNPYGNDPYFALYPAPVGCSGHRLCHLVLGMDPDDYLDTFDRVNLCAGRWRIGQAREAAGKIIHEQRRAVLFGAKVALAFAVPFAPLATHDQGRLLVVGHPSGLNRLWSESGAFLRAREAVAAFLPEIAHLLGRQPT